MPTPKKEATVAELADLIQRSNAVILTDYRGLKVSDINGLRRQLRDAESDYRVAKNSLTSLAVKSAGLDGLDAYLEGPTALAFSFGEPTAVAKVLSDFARSSRILNVRAGLLDGRVLSAEEVNELANIESREVLLAKVVGGLNSPLTGLVSVLNQSIAQIAYVLQARVTQLGGGEAASG